MNVAKRPENRATWRMKKRDRGELAHRLSAPEQPFREVADERHHPGDARSDLRGPVPFFRPTAGASP